MGVDNPFSNAAKLEDVLHRTADAKTRLVIKEQPAQAELDVLKTKSNLKLTDEERETNRQNIQEAVKEVIKEESMMTKSEIRAKYKGLESNIPVTSPYWTMKE